MSFQNCNNSQVTQKGSKTTKFCSMPEWHEQFMRILVEDENRADPLYVYVDKEHGYQANFFRSLFRFGGLRKCFPQSAEFDFIADVRKTSTCILLLDNIIMT